MIPVLDPEQAVSAMPRREERARNFHMGMEERNNATGSVRRDRAQFHDLAVFEFLESVSDADDVAVFIEVECACRSYIGDLRDSIAYGGSIRSHFTDDLRKKIGRIVGKCRKAQITLRLAELCAKVHSKGICSSFTKFRRGVDQFHPLHCLTGDLPEVRGIRDILTESGLGETSLAVLLHGGGDESIALTVRDKDIELRIFETRHERTEVLGSGLRRLIEHHRICPHRCNERITESRSIIRILADDGDFSVAFLRKYFRHGLRLQCITRIIAENECTG